MGPPPLKERNIVPSPPTNEEQAAAIEAWTEQASEALKAVSLSATEPVHQAVRGTSVTLSIPLDESLHRSTTARATNDDDTTTSYRVSTTDRPRSEPIRRDSLKRREALLKGKEGSRQRRRWENDRLLNNPHAVPPLPSDWEVRPTYPRHAVVPYYLAPLWDSEAYHRSLERKREAKKAKAVVAETGVAADPTAAHIPKEVREKLKRARAAKGLLQDLEEDVRRFVQQWSEKQTRLRNEGLHDVDSDTSDDEVVFVGRNGLMHDSPSRHKADEGHQEPIRRDKLVFDGLADDKGASFGRWLVHSIATYYGLRTWSVTVGDPARREAYVGIMERDRGPEPRRQSIQPLYTGLPRPLWCLV